LVGGPKEFAYLRESAYRFLSVRSLLDYLALIKRLLADRSGALAPPGDARVTNPVCEPALRGTL
jgi:hypothetical protein